jgi:hypothetical protein
MPDLYGNPDRLETRPTVAAGAPSLFEATAERLAYETGRALSQERIELINGAGVPIMLESTFGTRISQTCQNCGATYIARERFPSICNLCARSHAERG